MNEAQWRALDAAYYRAFLAHRVQAHRGEPGVCAYCESLINLVYALFDYYVRTDTEGME